MHGSPERRITNRNNISQIPPLLARYDPYSIPNRRPIMKSLTSNSARAVAAVLVFFTLSVSVASAEERRGERRVEHARYGNDHWAFDNRYNHNHYYPQFGYGVAALPPGHVVLSFRGDPFFFHSGVWYRRGGPGYVVARPPVGIIVPSLPAVIATVVAGGLLYYYANDVYYRQAPGGYVVAEEPVGAVEVAAPTMQQQPAMPSSPSQPQASATWYYCESSKTYYPYVTVCKEGWRQVAATPPQAR
jgi:hypothetical protein